MAGWSLAWDDLLSWLCAGFEAREKIQQHRVSTEGKRGGTMQRARMVFLQVMAEPKVARGGLPRGASPSLGLLPALGEGTQQQSETETV